MEAIQGRAPCKLYWTTAIPASRAAAGMRGYHEWDCPPSLPHLARVVIKHGRQREVADEAEAVDGAVLVDGHRVDVGDHLNACVALGWVGRCGREEGRVR